MISHHFSDGLYAKESAFAAGTAILKHTHEFSHLSILAASLSLSCGGYFRSPFLL
jgi:hypothetical protein